MSGLVALQHEELPAVCVIFNQSMSRSTRVSPAATPPTSDEVTGDRPDSRGHHKRRCMQLYATVLYYLGVFPGTDRPKSLLFYWRRYLPRVQLVRFVYTIVFNAISTYIVWGELIHMIDFATTILIYALTLVRYGSLYLHRGEVGRMFSRLEALHEPAQLGDETLRRKAEFTETTTRRMLVVLMPVYVGLVAASAGALVSRGLATRTVPFRLWLPYNYSSSPVFEVTLITVKTFSTIDFFMAAFPSFLFVAWCVHLIGQYKLLRYKIDNIRIFVEKKMGQSGDPKSAYVSIDMDEESGGAVEYTIIPLRGADVEDSVSNLPTDSEADDTVSDLLADSEAAQGERSGQLTIVRQHSGAKRSHVHQDGGDLLKEMKDLVLKVIECDKERARQSDVAVERCATPVEEGWRKMCELFKKCPDDQRTMETNTILNDVEVETCPKPGEQGWRKMRELFKKRREDQRALETRTSVEMEQSLRHCAKHHQTILRLTQDLERVFTYTLRLQTCVNFAAGVLSLKVTTLAPGFDALTITSCFTMIAVGLDYLFFCWFGNILTDESEMLREAVYGCEWYGASESFKRSIRIMISRTNKPEVLTAGGLPLSMKSFRFICRTAYYLNNVMVKIIHGVKINDKKR